MGKSTIYEINRLVEKKEGKKKMPTSITKEEYLQISPTSVSSIEKLPEIIMVTDAEDEKLTAIQKIAKYIDTLAREEGRSFAEVWLDVLEEGAKIDSVTKGGGVVSLLQNIRKTSVNIFKDQIDGLNPFKKKRRG